MTRATWIAIAALLAGFAGLAVVALVAPGNGVDLACTLAVQQLTALDGAFRFISWFGFGPVDVALPVLAMAGLAAARWWRDALYLGISVGGSAAANWIVKIAVGRARPAGSVRVEEVVTGSSFPSGHVMQYLALFGFLVLVARVRVAHRGLRAMIVAPLLALLFTVGLSRIYLGAHWLSDVTGAYLIGMAWLLVVGRAWAR